MVVEADLKTISQHLGIDSDAPLVIKNALGQEVTSTEYTNRKKVRQ